DKNDRKPLVRGFRRIPIAVFVRRPHANPGLRSRSLRRRMTVTKLPQITLAFWIMKIAATTLGETAGDLLAQTLKVGYLTSSLILVSLFLVSLVTQLKARKFHPALYWAVILSTSTAGTTMSDFMNRSAGLGYTNG